MVCRRVAHPLEGRFPVRRRASAVRSLSGLESGASAPRIKIAAVFGSAKPREVVVELGSLTSEIMSGVLTAFALLAAMMIALAVMIYIQARRAGRWMRTTLNRQFVNLAPGPGRDLVRMRARLDRCLQGARGAVATATANGEAVGDLCLLCARLEAAGGRLDAQLEVIAGADLSPSMLNAALKPLRARVDASSASRPTSRRLPPHRSQTCTVSSSTRSTTGSTRCGTS